MTPVRRSDRRRLRRSGTISIVVLAAVVVLARPATATPPPLATPATAPDNLPPSPAPTNVPGAPQVVPASENFLTGIQKRDTFFGTAFGIRPELAKHGITFAASETSEELGNVTGGTRQGFVYDGLLQMDLQVDTNRAFGLRGGTLNASALQIHGHNLSAENLSTLQTASGIEADQASRLWELWYDQQLNRAGTVDVKLGQQSLDQEFMVSQNALLFVNTMFGWPLLPSSDLPGGGPAYPLSALGVRGRARVNDSVVVLGGVFNGNPAPTNLGDPQVANPSGLSFPLDGGALAIAEVQYTYPGLGALVYPGKPQPLSRVLRLGGWYDTESFADQAVDRTGVPLAFPASAGQPKRHRGDFAIYGVADQLLYQSPEAADRTLNAFARVMGTPLGDRNLIQFSANLGLTLHEPIVHRDDDTLGLGFGYGRVGTGAMVADEAAASVAGTPGITRSAEFFGELTYQYQVYPWLQLQPDVQYVFNPGAGLSNGIVSNQRIQNEAVLGLRALVAL